jgi:Mu transposase, C-terminal domain
VLRGYQREETTRFVAFRSHWQFQAEFCNVAEGHEKGGVENEVGTFRRNHLVPIPQARDLADLNQQLLVACREDEGRILEGREQSIGAHVLLERAHLLPLATEDFDLAETAFPKVGELGWVKVRTNAYSVPLAAGTSVQAKILPSTIDLWHEGKCIASHERSYGRHQEILDLEHYLDVLEHKPGALAGSKPLEQWRKQGRWPHSYDRFWEGLIARQGKAVGTKEMIGLVQLGKAHGQEKLRAAIEEALALGCQDSAAVRHLLSRATLQKAPTESLDVGSLAAFSRPLPTISEYDQLLAVGGIR